MKENERYGMEEKSEDEDGDEWKKKIDGCGGKERMDRNEIKEGEGKEEKWKEWRTEGMKERMQNS